MNVVRYFSAEQGIDLDKAVMIGDSPCDIVMGKTANMKTIAIAYGGAKDPLRLAEHKPDVLIDDEKNIVKLPKIISALLNSKNR